MYSLLCAVYLMETLGGDKAHTQCTEGGRRGVVNGAQQHLSFILYSYVKQLYKDIFVPVTVRGVKS